MITKKHILLIVWIATASLLHADQYSFESNNETAVYGLPGNTFYQPQPCSDECSNLFFLRADLLYWAPNVSELALDFGTTSMTQTTIDGTQVITTDEFDTDPHFKWDAGYRVAAGYQFAYNWEIGAFWTHFQGNGTHESNEDETTINKGKLKLKFNQIDLALAYNVALCPSITLKPFLGVRGTQIQEKLKAHLATNITVSPATFAKETRTFNDSQNYHGIGPVLGLQGDWGVGCGFSLYGTAAASILYGRYKVHFNDTSIFTAPFSKEVFSTNRRNLHAFNCNIDLALGIRWQTYICDSFLLNMNLGFEHHQYFNQNHIGANVGDLALTGGIFSLSTAF